MEPEAFTLSFPFSPDRPGAAFGGRKVFKSSLVLCRCQKELTRKALKLVSEGQTKKNGPFISVVDLF